MTQKAHKPNEEPVFRPPASRERKVSLTVDESSSGIHGEANIVEVPVSDIESNRRFLVNFNTDRSLMWNNINPHKRMNNPDVPQYSATSLWKDMGSYRHPTDEEPFTDTTNELQERDTGSAKQERNQQDLTRALVVDEVNKRVVAPLLLGTGLLLLIAAIGALLNGSVLLALVFLPAPVATFWLLWNARNKWQ